MCRMYFSDLAPLYCKCHWHKLSSNKGGCRKRSALRIIAIFIPFGTYRRNVLPCCHLVREHLGVQSTCSALLPSWYATVRLPTKDAFMNERLRVAITVILESCWSQPLGFVSGSTQCTCIIRPKLNLLASHW